MAPGSEKRAAQGIVMLSYFGAAPM